MKEKERYERAYSRRMSSVNDIKAFAREILLEEGYDPDIVNLKEDGISISSFKKLVDALYKAGYQDGIRENAELREQRKKLENQGKILTHHARRSKFFQEHNELNKKFK